MAGYSLPWWNFSPGRDRWCIHFCDAFNTQQQRHLANSHVPGTGQLCEQQASPGPLECTSVRGHHIMSDGIRGPAKANCRETVSVESRQAWLRPAGQGGLHEEVSPRCVSAVGSDRQGSRRAALGVRGQVEGRQIGQPGKFSHQLILVLVFPPSCFVLYTPTPPHMGK